MLQKKRSPGRTTKKIYIKNIHIFIYKRTPTTYKRGYQIVATKEDPDTCYKRGPRHIKRDPEIKTKNTIPGFSGRYFARLVHGSHYGVRVIIRLSESRWRSVNESRGILYKKKNGMVFCCSFSNDSIEIQRIFLGFSFWGSLL